MTPDWIVVEQCDPQTGKVTNELCVPTEFILMIAPQYEPARGLVQQLTPIVGKALIHMKNTQVIAVNQSFDQIVQVLGGSRCVVLQ